MRQLAWRRVCLSGAWVVGMHDGVCAGARVVRTSWPVCRVLRSVGAAYVPLDPTHPSDRLRSLASNAEVSVVVVDVTQVVAHWPDLGVGSVSVAELGVAGDGGAGVGEG